MSGLPAAPLPEVTVAMLAYGPEPHLEAAIDAVLASTGVTVSVVLVDNGSSHPEVAALGARPGVSLLSPGRNTGFSGGCNLALSGSSSEFVALVNSDAIVAVDALAALVQCLADPAIGIATASVRLAGAPEIVNSAGNPVTFTGLSWAGGLGEPASRHTVAREVASASGAFLAMRGDTWTRLGGFDEEFLAYHEDTDISLRCWQAGLSVRFEPAAVALHHYEFSRNPGKSFLLERNRLMTLAVDFEGRTLALIMPALLLVEAGVIAAAVVGGWLPEKARAYVWLWRHRDHLRARRRLVQSARIVPDRDLAHLLQAPITPGTAPGDPAVAPPGTAVLNSVLSLWWRIIRPRL